MKSDQVILRTETINDYSQVSEVHAAAFDYSTNMGEAALVALLRQQKHYDAELSLVAEIDGHIVGHTLFTPYQMMLHGSVVRAVLLAPLSFCHTGSNKE